MGSRRPAWLPWLAALAALVMFSALGLWQLQRAAEKAALIDRIERGTSAPARPLPASPEALRAHAFQRIRADGRFMSERQFLLDNRTFRGRAGFDVLTPLALQDGRAVLVDRGWVEAGPRRQPVSSVDLQTVGPVTVSGRLWLPDEAIALGPALAPDRSWPRVTTRVDHAALGEALGRELVPAVIRADGDAPWVLQPRALEPSFGPARHYGYAVQWFALAITVLVIAVLLVYFRKRELRNE